MRPFYLFMISLCVFPAIVIQLLAGSKMAVSFLAGGAVAIVNVLFIQMIWARILSKKSVASIIGLIVLKYTLLIVVLYRAANSPQVATGWFLSGTAVLVLAAIGHVVVVGRKSGSSF